MKLSQKAVSNTHRVLVFGAPKTGKSQLVGTLAAKYNLLWFDLENGYATLLKLPLEQQERIEIISLPDTRSNPIAIETMLKVIKGLPVEICEEHGKVACPSCKKDSKPSTRVALNEIGDDTVVVIDSLTQLTNSTIAFITKGKDDTYKMDWDDWAHQGKILDTFLSIIQQARYNVVCISHETEVTMEDGKEKLVPTAGTRNFSRNTAKYFDHVVYIEVKNKKHTAGSATTFSAGILSGSRTDFEVEKEPTLTLLGLMASTNRSAADQGQVALNSLKQAKENATQESQSETQAQVETISKQQAQPAVTATQSVKDRLALLKLTKSK